MRNYYYVVHRGLIHKGVVSFGNLFADILANHCCGQCRHGDIGRWF